MRHEISLTSGQDNSNGWRLGRACRSRKRTVNISFELDDSDKFYNVRAWGDAIEDAIADGGGGELRAKLRLDKLAAQAAIADLQKVWQTQVVERKESRDGVPWFRFADWDLSSADNHRRVLDEVMRSVAREGSKLFRVLFYKGDWKLKELANAVVVAMRSEGQIVSIHSDDLFAPWWMLYIPEADDIDMYADDAPWTWRGFWGYSHLIEHNLSRIPGWKPCLHRTGERVTAGVNVDSGIDDEYPKVPCIGPLVDMFRDDTLAIIRESKAHLARDIKSPDFADQIMFFGCHGKGALAPKLTLASVALTDRQPIGATELIDWLTQTPFTHGPLVFINACEMGQMSSFFYTDFGKELLGAGANCLLGPQVDIPKTFSREYAQAFFGKMLAGETRAGDAILELTRYCADQLMNPLGLIISLYRGLDTHLCSDAMERDVRSC